LIRRRRVVVAVVQFLGKTEVDEPKGIDVVKEGIRKMKFTEHLKRAEGAKSPKVELTISIDGVAVQEPKGKRILHQFPLHHLSYCADDKTDKKFFSFIAKDISSDKHVCFVFVSDKLAEEITLTIGQAFDLAYRRFLETSGRDLEMRRQLMVLQKRVQELEKENQSLKQLVQSYESCSKLKSKAKLTNGISNGSLSTLPAPQPLKPPPVIERTIHSIGSTSLLDADDPLIERSAPAVGRKLENLSMDDMDDLDDFNPRASESRDAVRIVKQNGVHESALNGHVNGNGNMNQNDCSISQERDVFGSEPFNPNPEIATNGSEDQSNGHHRDPFGMGSFQAQELEDAIGAIDKKLAEMRVCVHSPVADAIAIRRLTCCLTCDPNLIYFIYCRMVSVGDYRLAMTIFRLNLWIH
jgi:hypothetical protein